MIKFNISTLVITIGIIIYTSCSPVKSGTTIFMSDVVNSAYGILNKCNDLHIYASSDVINYFNSIKGRQLLPGTICYYCMYKKGKVYLLMSKLCNRGCPERTYIDNNKILVYLNNNLVTKYTFSSHNTYLIILGPPYYPLFNNSLLVPILILYHGKLYAFGNSNPIIITGLTASVEVHPNKIVKFNTNLSLEEIGDIELCYIYNIEISNGYFIIHLVSNRGYEKYIIEFNAKKNHINIVNVSNQKILIKSINALEPPGIIVYDVNSGKIVFELINSINTLSNPKILIRKYVYNFDRAARFVLESVLNWFTWRYFNVVSSIPSPIRKAILKSNIRNTIVGKTLYSTDFVIGNTYIEYIVLMSLCTSECYIFKEYIQPIIQIIKSDLSEYPGVEIVLPTFMGMLWVAFFELIDDYIIKHTVMYLFGVNNYSSVKLIALYYSCGYVSPILEETFKRILLGMGYSMENVGVCVGILETIMHIIESIIIGNSYYSNLVQILGDAVVRSLVHSFLLTLPLPVASVVHGAFNIEGLSQLNNIDLLSPKYWILPVNEILNAISAVIVNKILQESK